MYPLEPGGCAMLALSSPCPSHLRFSSHVSRVLPPVSAQASLRSSQPHPHALSHTHLLSAPPTRRWWRRAASNSVARGHHKSLVPGWVFTPTPYLFLIIIDMGRSITFLCSGLDCGNLWVEISLDPRSKVPHCHGGLANSPNFRFPPVPL